MADISIKPEIKVEPALNDAEEFEDDTDLAFPPPESTAWLARVPEDLWKAWADVYKDAPDDATIEIGKMRVYHQPPTEDQDPRTQKLQLRLAPHVPQHREISKRYDLKINTRGYNNTVVFSEKDLPGHKRSNNGRLQPKGIPGKDQRYGKDQKLRSRSEVPKQTALCARVQHEATATPVMDAAYTLDFAKKWAAHTAPKKTTFQAGIDRSMDTNSTKYLNTFSTFSTSSVPKTKKSRGAQAGKDKAVRMERTELLTALQQCFRRYRYWPLKALRTELRQPEAHLRETLDEIAYLVRSGDFAMNWTLKQEWQQVVQADDGVKMEEVADVGTEREEGTGEGSDDEDDGEDEGGFEDVQMDG